MLTVEVKINGRLIATAQARNLSDLADVSDYPEAPSAVAGHTGLYLYNKISGHNRRQSSWALVRKIAALAAKEHGHG